MASLTVGTVAQAQETPAPTLSDRLQQIERAADYTASDRQAPRRDASADLNPLHNSMDQVTAVTQLNDVQPTDWAYQALRSLVERYGCIAGYPNGTFRGDRALTRSEFAAGLNACLDRIIELQPVNIEPELDTLRRLQEEFAAELATLRGRVDSLEARAGELEANQFSTTTKLFGQVVVGVQGRTDNDADFFPVDGVQDTADPSTNVNLITNTQLTLFTEFDDRTILLTGLQVGTGSTAPRLTNDTRLSYEANTDGELQLSDLSLRHLIGDDFAVIFGPKGVNPVNVFRGANRVESAGFGPISAFAQRNPIIALGAGQGGVGFDWQIADPISLQGVYSVSEISDPGSGLFGSATNNTTLGVQLAIAPTPDIDIVLNYLNAYTPSGSLGTGIGDSQLTAGSDLNTDAFGGTVAWRVTDGFTLGGWVGFTNSVIPGQDGSVDTFNWMAFLNFPDLFGEGHLGGIYVGQPPRITRSNLTVGQNIPNLLTGGTGMAGDQPGTTTHVEAFYRYRLSDHISITPGMVLIFDPAHTPDSDTIAIGALRTTFSF